MPFLVAVVKASAPHAKLVTWSMWNLLTRVLMLLIQLFFSAAAWKSTLQGQPLPLATMVELTWAWNKLL